MKICSCCKEIKDINDFYRNGSGRCGYASQCKECANKYQRERKAKNRPLVPKITKIANTKKLTIRRDLGVDFIDTENSRVEDFEDIEFATRYVGYDH